MSFTNETTREAEFVTRRKHLRLASRHGRLTIDGVPVGPIFGGTAPELNFRVLLGVLGYRDTEFVSICHQAGDGPFLTRVCAPADAPEQVEVLAAQADIYFGVNPVKGPARFNGGRGKAEDVTRLTALYADLDVEPGKCPDMATAVAIIDELSGILTTRPVAVTHSGHGFHPYWLLDRESAATLSNAEAGHLVKRFGWLVKVVADHHDCKLDNVSELARVLRVPGTFNRKNVTNGEGGTPVVCYADAGTPLTIEQIRSAFDAFGVSEKPLRSVNANSNGAVPHEVFRRRCLVNRVRKATEGRRNTTLFGAAKDAARQGDLDGDMIAGLTSAAKESGLGEAEIASTIRSAELSSYSEPPAQIDEELFWTSCDELRDLRQFARARRVGPWAMLGYVLARVVAAIPPTVVLPPLVGSHASLNLFVALVGPSGAGKGGASGAAADWLTTDPPAFTATLGSGEGLAKMFAYKHRLNRNKGSWIQTGLRASVVFDAPEVDNLTALTTRSSSTLLPQLRSAYSGEELGFSYADPAKAVRLCAHRYRLCLTLGVQPGRGKALLDDADGGTPQRFVWLPTDDIQAPDEPPDLPAVRDLRRWPDQPVGRLVSSAAPETLLDRPVTNAALRVLEVPDEAREAIDSHRVAMLRGGAVEPLDGHRLLCRLKVAAAFMWLDGRTDEISNDDWSLAGIVMAVSDHTRRGVADVLRSKARAENVSRGRGEGLREIARTEVVQLEQAERVQRVADNIERKLKDNGGDLARGALRKMIHLRDRRFFDDAEVLLTETGRVDKVRSDNSGPNGFVLRLAGEGASK